MRVFVHEKCIKKELAKDFETALENSFFFYELTEIRFNSSDTLQFSSYEVISCPRPPYIIKFHNILITGVTVEVEDAHTIKVDMNLHA